MSGVYQECECCGEQILLDTQSPMEDMCISCYEGLYGERVSPCSGHHLASEELLEDEEV